MTNIEGWFITMAFFAVVTIVGFILHKYEERVSGMKTPLEEMNTFGSIIFTVGVCGGAFSLGILVLCI